MKDVIVETLGPRRLTEQEPVQSSPTVRYGLLADANSYCLFLGTEAKASQDTKKNVALADGWVQFPNPTNELGQFFCRQFDYFLQFSSRWMQADSYLLADCSHNGFFFQTQGLFALFHYQVRSRASYNIHTLAGLTAEAAALEVVILIAFFDNRTGGKNGINLFGIIKVWVSEDASPVYLAQL